MPASATASMRSGTRTTLSMSEYSVCSRKCTKFAVIGRPMPSIEFNRGERLAEQTAGRQAFNEPGSQGIETTPMTRRGSESGERHQVRPRAVAEVRAEAVAWMLIVEPAHERVAVGLGDDRGGADAGHERIAADDGFDFAIPKAIMQLRCTVTVNH